jgi:photosystem II stability/assembly factor-like uncharacterized protein
MRRALVAALLVLAAPAPARAQPLDAERLAGLSFRTIGPATMSGRIVDLAVVERDPYTFYVASATGGVWKTVNNGTTFEPVFEHEPVHSVGAIAVHPVADSIVWVGTGERANRQSSSWGNGVYRSTDGGRTWTHAGLDDSHHVGRIALHPTDPDVAYVAAMGHLWGPNDERGLYRTADGGSTWNRILFVDQDTGVVDVALDPSNPDLVYAATYQRRRRAWGFHGGGPGSGLYRSEDAGATWTRLGAGLPEGDLGRIGISIHRADPAVVYVCVEQGWRYNASTAYGERRAGIYRSGDHGLTWAQRSDWNPRPMYASQILVDPVDPDRVYMMNEFSVSEDGGVTFSSPRQTLHGDDRILWVNPADTRHLVKGDDGGLGISYDRGRTWLYVRSLPVSQFYRVDVDDRDPYWVYGGLQDNGSWAAPNATRRTEGILHEDWIRTGGGDGFVNRPHPDDPERVYTESQYLGLSVLDLATGERRDIRPGDPQGSIEARRNWDAWIAGEPEPELANAMAPANWDAPFVFSPHDPNTLYAGTDVLWKSTDAGSTWTPLGSLTSGTDRRTLPIMGQAVHDSLASLDDGIPYWPTLSAVAESPLAAGLLYAGTDDGLFHASGDGGRTWTEASRRMPGLPGGATISGIEPSAHVADRVYVAVNNYRNDDFGNYLFASDDRGASWRSIAGDLPERRVARTVREDPRNPDVLYLGTEFGLFVTLDRGMHWTRLGAGMPTVAVNDLVVQERENDVVVATHGRGIWILDQLSALQGLTPRVRLEPGHLFRPGDARLIRYRGERGHEGDMIFRGQNPPTGAILDYWLKESVEPGEIALTILDELGDGVRSLEADTAAGVNRVVWDLRRGNLPFLPPDTTDGGPARGRGPAGPAVMPGRFTVRLEVAGSVSEAPLRILPDPRADVPIDVARAWLEDVRGIGDLYARAVGDASAVVAAHRQVERLEEGGRSFDRESRAELRELHDLYAEIVRRLRGLYSDTGGWTGPTTADQQDRRTFLAGWVDRLGPRRERFLERTLDRLNRGLPAGDRIVLP